MAAPHPHPLESVVLRTDIGRVCALPRQQANLLVRHFVRISRATSPYAAAARRTPLPAGDREMERPFTPYELDVAVCDSSLGSAAGPDNMLNEFPHRLGPVCVRQNRTMIHNSLANGSLHGSWNTVDTISFPNPGRSMRPEELHTHHAALRLTKVNRKDASPPSVSIIAATPTSIWLYTLAVLHRTW
ncbi:hypothetical protein TcBrA4_0068480 [Trypanosoma cruzi]|nr:hypothetical protein TcBrA4_0068480 [Trypanosoma cruzi]